MTSVKIEPEEILKNFLRANLTDPNSARSGQWVYPDFPRVQDLGNASFPRIGITKITESSEHMGMFDDNKWYTINMQVDIVAKKDHSLSVTVTDEALGTMSSTVNSNRFTFDFVPTTVTNIKHDGSSYGTVTKKDTDADFTAPGSLAAGTVEYSFSTGNLNFSAADVSSHDTDAITSTYVISLEAVSLVQWLAREVIKNVRTGWRTDSTMDGLDYPVLISNNPVPFDEDLGIYRVVVEYKFNAVNTREVT